MADAKQIRRDIGKIHEGFQLKEFMGLEAFYEVAGVNNCPVPALSQARDED